MTLKPDNIPGDMIFLDQWICWVTEMRDGKPTKIPKSPNSSRNAGTDSPETWGSFVEAKEAYKEKDYDGIGFVFTEDDEFLGVDLDDCRDADTGEWKEWALDIIEQLGGFIEISPSGTGGHVILKGEIPGNRNRRGDIEMYEDGRYFTVTGDVVDTSGERLDEDNKVPNIQDAEDGLEEVYTEYLEDEDDDSEDDDNNTKSRSSPALDLDDHQNGSAQISSSTGANLDDLSDELQEIVLSAKKSRNGHKFTQLWRGNWEQVYPPDEVNPNSKSNNTYSQSEADMAFCGMLAFWCSGDAERMDKIFRASGLMRRKWKKQHFSDGSTYGEHTIQRALDEVENYYDEEYYQNEVKEDTDGFEDDDPNDEDDNNSGTSTDGSSEEESESDTEEDNQSQNRSNERDGIDGFVTGSDTESNTSSQSESAESTSVEDDKGNNSEQEDNDNQTSSRNDDRDISIDDFEPTHTGSAESGDEEGEDTTSDSEAAGEIPEPSVDDNSDEEFYTELNERFEEPEPEQDVESAEKAEGGLFDTDSETDDTHDNTENDDQDEDDNSESEIDISKEEGKSIIDDLEEDNQDDDDDSVDSSSSENQQTKPSESNSTNTGSNETLDTDPFDTTDDNTTDDSGSDTLSTSELERKVNGDNEAELPEHVNQKIQAILAKINELENTVETNKEELLHDIKLEDDKLEQIYRELLEFERIVEKRNEQFETIQQALILLCRSHPNPIFKEIAEVLSQEEEIPMQNIFGEESMAEISAHDIELAAKGSVEREEANDEARATETESSTEDDSSSSTLSRLF